MIKLYGYWRSSAAYRVRIVLHLKGIEFESIPIHLLNDGGEQHKAEYVQLNPAELVPTFVDSHNGSNGDGEVVLSQSLAIIDYIDSVYRQTTIYPEKAANKALIQAFALDIACDIHPLNNLRVQQYLVNNLAIDNKDKSQWVNYWLEHGLTALEARLQKSAGKYCFGEEITLADVCLIPQVYNAVRVGIDINNYPIINRVTQACNLHPAFIKALPENQPDAQ